MQHTYAQTNVSVSQAIIQAQADINTVAINGKLVVGLGVAPSIDAQPGAANIPATTTGTVATIPITNFFIKVLSINSLALLGGNNETQLSSAKTRIFTALAAVGGGDIQNNYRLVIAGTPWVAGTYTTPITFTANALLGASITNPVQQLNITVDAFITSRTALPSSTQLHVNSLALFRSTPGISNTATFDYYTSVPTVVNLKATAGTFAFSTTYPYNQLPAAINVNTVTATVSDLLATTPVSLSTIDQALTAATGLPVIATNIKSLTPSLSVSGANLKAGFVQAGTYTAGLTYTIAKLASAYPTTLASVPMTSSVQVLVDDMSELILNDASVSLAFSTAANYSQGITKQMPNHLKASSTVPYDVTVKASSNFFTSAAGGQIPVGVITIEGIPSQTGITPVVLSSTAQKIISSANPAIDRLLSLQYRIPASQTSNLLKKAAGNYTTTVTYTLVAP